MLDILAVSLFGTAAGIVMGLFPGMNINNVLPLVLSVTAFLQPQYVAVLIVSMAVAQVFVGYIPSVFLGAPSEDTSLSVLPGHRMLLEGRGYEAIKLTVLGGLGSLALTVVLVFLLSNYFVSLYNLSRPYIAYVLMLVIALMVLAEKKLRKILLSLGIVMLSGLLGVVVLGSVTFSQQNIMFPLLAGLFGMSTIVMSVSEKSSIPEQQKESRVRSKKSEIAKSIVMGSLAGIAVGFLPAVGVSQAATMTQYMGGVGDAGNFLTTLSGINVANEVFSLNSLYLMNNPRSGASVAIERVMPKPGFGDMVTLTGAIAFASVVAAGATLYLGKRIPRMLARIDYRKLSVAIMAFLVGMVFFSTGWQGLLVLFTSTSIGVLCARLKVRRSNCMGVLLIPSLLFFLGMNPFVLSLLGI